MTLVDVNVLVYAHREESARHAAARAWLEERAASPEVFAVCDLALAGFLRIVTSGRIFDPPTPLDAALQFVEQIRALPNYVAINPGLRHWEIFMQLCRSANPRGNLIPDAYLAAIAIESGSEWMTTDRGFGRYPGLRWRDPLPQ